MPDTLGRGGMPVRPGTSVRLLGGGVLKAHACLGLRDRRRDARGGGAAAGGCFKLMRRITGLSALQAQRNPRPARLKRSACGRSPMAKGSV